MTAFRKNLVIEAEQWLGPESNVEGVVKRDSTYGPSYVIKTLEGDMLVSSGDWIIIGVKGEKYPCKPDIFEMTYEKVDVRSASATELFQAIRIECDRLHMDSSIVEVDTPLVDDNEEGWSCGIVSWTKTCGFFAAATLEEALEKLLKCLRGMS